jgi:broad specificity phosphatase PhoE
MKYLEHRRHTERTRPHDHINQKGIDLAKRAAETAGPFHYVLTSTVPRAVETALVLGYEVNRMDDLLFHYKPELMDELGNRSFQAIVKAIEAGRYTYSYAQDQLNLLREALDEVEDGETVLVVSHGSMVEIGLVAMFPNLDYEKWEKPFTYLEGYRVGYENGEFNDPQILRTS